MTPVANFYNIQKILEELRQPPSQPLVLTRDQWKRLTKEFDWEGPPNPQIPTFINPFAGALGAIAGIPIYILEPKKAMRYRRHPCNKRVRLKQRRVLKCW